MPVISRRQALIGSAGAVAALATPPSVAHAAEVEVRFFYPVAVAGPLTKIIDDYAAQFEKEHPGIKIKPVYSGDYVQTVGKALTAFKGGDAPELAILQASDILTMTDQNAVIPFDGFIKTAEDKAWLDGFFPAFMENSRAGGKTYGIPFQRSTPVLYWNKEAFKEAGLDPEKAPGTWAEVIDFGKKLTKKDASGAITQYGIEIPSDGNTLWLFTGLATANDIRMVNAEGNRTFFDDPKVIEAAQFNVDLTSKYGIQPAGVTSWGSAPKEFLEKRLAMIFHTTGNLTNIRKNATFPYGVAMLPAKAHRGAPTGGGNFYMFNGLSAEKQAAAFAFVRWMTTSERAAEWSVNTGYVATSKAAYETEAMKKFITEVPQAAVARDQLPFAVSEVTCHEGQRIAKIFADNMQAALTGSKSVTVAMTDTQAEAERILKAYR